MNYFDVVRDLAQDLGFLDEQGRLVRLDSLSSMDFIAAIEQVTQLQIPSASLRQELFASLETIADLLDRVARKAS